MHIMFILSEGIYVTFCIFNEFSFNIYKNSAVFPQLKPHKTKTKMYYYQILLTKIKITIHTSTMQSFIALTLFKAEQTSVVVKAQTLPIFIKIAQNKGNHKSVSNLYRQFIHNKTHF